MPIFRPDGGKSSSSSSFYGICPIAIVNFEDKSERFDWSDIYIEVTIRQEGSEYEKTLRIAGSLEKDMNGYITGGSVLNRMYHFFDQIGCQAGMNVDGKWEDKDGNNIKSIEAYLNQHHTEAFIPDADNEFNYLAYVYKEKPKEKGGKVYSRVFHKIYKNASENRPKLEDDVNWFKSKGYLKEATDSDINTPKKNVEMSDTGLGNL